MPRKGRKGRKGGGMFDSVSGAVSNTGTSVSDAFNSINPFGSNKEKKDENSYPSSDSSYYPQSTVGGRRKRRSKKRRSMRGGDFTDNTETGLASTAAPVESEGKMFGGKRKTKRRSRKNKRSKSKSRRR